MGNEHGNRCELKESSVEKDLRNIVVEDLSWKEHISTIVNKANRILGILKRAIICRDPGLWKESLRVLGKTTFRVCYASFELIFGGRCQKDRKGSRKSNKDPLWIR